MLKQLVFSTTACSYTVYSTSLVHFASTPSLRRLDLHVHRLRPRQLVVSYRTPRMISSPVHNIANATTALTKLAQTNAPPAVLHARPRERGVEVVAPVQEHRARLQLLHDREERLLGLRVRRGVRPHGRREPVRRVVHECDRLVV